MGCILKDLAIWNYTGVQGFFVCDSLTEHWWYNAGIYITFSDWSFSPCADTEEHHCKQKRPRQHC
jgi:hypothetical protein